MAKGGSVLIKLQKGSFNYSSFRLGFHSIFRSIHNNNIPCIRSDWETDWEVAINSQFEFEKVYDLNLNVPKFTNIDAGFNLLDGVIHTRPLPSVDNFNHLLDAVTNMKHYSYSIHLFKQMCDIGVPVDENSMSIAIKCYCHLYNTHHGFTVLGYFLKRGILPNAEIYNTLLDGFILQDKTHEAERLFKNIIFKLEDVCEPNVVTYNNMIKGLCKVGNYFKAIGLIRLMDVRGCKPDLVTYNTIIHSLCDDLLIDDALKLFKEMVLHKAIHPNVVTYNTLISALCKLDRWDDVSCILKQMQDENISPDVPTFTILLDAFAEKGNMNEAKLVFDLMSRSGNYPDIRTYNSLIHGYCLRGEMNKAKSVFDSIGVKPNIHTYNSLLNGYVKVCRMDEAAHLYNELINKESKLKPDMATNFIMIEVWDRSEYEFIDKQSARFLYVKRLEHVFETFQIEEALSLFRYGDASNYNSNSALYCSVILAARKCGKLDIARRFFHDIHGKRMYLGSFIYEAMITCLCEEGLLKEAKQMVYKMEKSDGGELSADGIADLVEGYLKFKPPFDELYMFLELFEQRIDNMWKSYEALCKFENEKREGGC